jgi:hypothetical protein
MISFRNELGSGGALGYGTVFGCMSVAMFGVWFRYPVLVAVLHCFPLAC